MNNTATLELSNEDKASRIEHLLKSFWQIDTLEFVGIYNPHEKGKQAWFKELRSPTGTLLYFPENEDLNIKSGIASAFVFPNQKLKQGEWYGFRAQMNPDPNQLDRNPLFVSPQSFQPVSKVVLERIKKEKFIKDLFSRNGNTPDDAQNLANSLRNFQIELYTKTERFIFELLQNADDFPLQGKSVEVDFMALNENILIYHNGKTFSEGDVKSICSIGNSSKSKDVSATGYKGIGFKSVFTHSKCVYINSGGYSFCFDSEFNAYKSFTRLYKEHENDPYYAGKYQEYVGSHNIPWQLKPIWRENYMYPREVRFQSDFFKSNVGFCLEFGYDNTLEFNKKIFELFKEPRFLLFLRNISKINVATNQSRSTTISRDLSDSITTLTDGVKSQQYLTYSCNPIDFSDRKESFKNIQNIPPKLIDLPYLTISFAALINDRKIEVEQDSILFTYLPTEDRSYNFPFLVNCDFVTSSNREQILPDNKWNEFVFEQIGYEIFNWIKHVSKTNDKYIDSVFNIIPSKFTKDIEIQHSFNRGYDKAIDEIAFILDNDSQFQFLKNILIDEIGIINILGVEQFQELTQLIELPINESLANNKKVKSLIKDYQVGKIFGIENLIALITEGALDEWLTIPANNIKFFQKLVNGKIIADKFKTLNIFLDQDGELKTAEELYWSIEGDLRYIDWLEPQYLMPEIRQALEVNEYFKDCFKDFEFKEYVKTHIIPEKIRDAVDAKLDDRSTSLKFYRFLFKYRINIDDNLKKDLKWFKSIGKKEIIFTLAAEKIYFSNPKIDEIADKGWLPVDAFSILSDEFPENDSVEDWKVFWKTKFEVKEYDSDSFIGSIVLNLTPANKAAIVAHIADKNHNLNFYRHIFAHQNVINSDRKALLKTFPVWRYEGSTIPSFDNDNIFLPDAALLEVHEREIIPNSLFQILSDDFCESATESAKWQSFWETYFDVKQYEAGAFISKIILENREATNNHQKTDSDQSIKFWSYLLDNNKATFSKEHLSNFHVLVKHEEGDTARFDQLSNCYLSDEYNEKGIESLVKEFKTDDAVFISPVYGGSDTKKWAKFFKECSIKHDESGLILNDLLPILSGRTQVTSVKDIQLLFKFSKIIEENNQWQALKNVNVLTKEGFYLNIQECFITDDYTGFSIVNDVLPSIYLQYQVFDVYLTDESERDKWLIFWKKFVLPNHILDEQDKVIEQKIKCLLAQQDTEGYRAKHLEHLKDLTELYEHEENAEEKNAATQKQLECLKDWKLRIKDKAEYAPPKDLYLPSVYNPTFDYEGLGVTDLITIQFVSETYFTIATATDFIKSLGVSESFVSTYINVLTQTKAAHRFWELWVNGTFTNFKFIKDYIKEDLVCIPCGETCKTPNEIYSLEIADYVVDKSRLSSVDLKSIMIDEKNVEDFLEFQKIPSPPDCLAFLKTQPKKEQFEIVMGWLKSYNPTDLLNNEPIQDFKQTGKWLNANNKWVDINSLLYFGALPYEIRSLFSSNPHRIKFPQGTEGVDEQKICTWLGIDILTVDDFDINVAGKRLDTDFMNILNDRLELICFYVFGSNWAQKTSECRLKLSEWSFFICSEITQTYNKVDKNIPLSMSAFEIKVFEDKKEVCYVNSWNDRTMFLDVINAVGKILKFKEDIRGFFDDNRYIVIDRLEAKGLNVPEDWKRPKPSPNTTFTNNGHSTTSSNQTGSSKSNSASNGQTNHKTEEPKVYDLKIEQILRGLDGLGKNSQYSINHQTIGEALIWLEKNGWNIENAKAEFGVLNDVRKDENTYSIIVRSAKTGLLRLDQYNWCNLGLENYKLLVQTGVLLSDFILYDTQTELLNAPYNSQSIIVKQNTKQPSILTNMVEGLHDADKATLYFITSEKGASIFNNLTGLKTQSDQESAIISDNDL